MLSTLICVCTLTANNKATLKPDQIAPFDPYLPFWSVFHYYSRHSNALANATRRLIG